MFLTNCLSRFLAQSRITPNGLLVLAFVTSLSACGASEDTGLNSTGDLPQTGAALGVDGGGDIIDTDGGMEQGNTPQTTPDVSAVDTSTSEVGSISPPSLSGPTDESTGIITTTGSTTDTKTPISGLPPIETMAVSALDLIQQHSELSWLTTAIENSSLSDYLADPKQRVTLFAFSDTAFLSLSTAQRDALLGDTIRLDALLRGAIVPELRLSESAASNTGYLTTLTNSRIAVSRENNVISIQVEQFNEGEPLFVSDSIVNEIAAIHVIDDFTHTTQTFFAPDENSIMDKLNTTGDSLLSRQLQYSSWYRHLGNSERQWTVFNTSERLDESNTNMLSQSLSILGAVESHIFERDAGSQMVIATGPLTSVGGSTHTVIDSENGLRIDGVKVTELDSMDVNNGMVHTIDWGLGDYISVLDHLQLPGRAYDDNGKFVYVYPRHVKYRFFTELIKATGEQSRYDGTANEVSLVVPIAGMTQAESDSRISSSRMPVATLYDVFDHSGADEGFSFIPDIFPDISSARTFLFEHTFDAVITAELLENNVGGYLENHAGTSLAITENVREIDGVAYTLFELGGQELIISGHKHRAVYGGLLGLEPAANGSVLSTVHPLSNTPDFSTFYTDIGLVPIAEPEPEFTGTSDSALAELGGYEIARTSISSTYSEVLDSRPWTVFLPSDSALAAAGITELSVEQLQYHFILTAADPAALVEMGSFFPSNGLVTYEVAGDGLNVTVNGLAVNLLMVGDAGAQIYSIDGILGQ